MARRFLKRETSQILAAAEKWIKTCLIEDRSMFLAEPRWTASLINEVYQAFVEHPDYGDDDFMTKLKNQMRNASAPAQQLMAEMLGALLLFPSNVKARTKRQQIRDIWALSGQHLAESHPLLDDQVLAGIGSGGPGFNNYRPNELEYLIALVRDLKQKEESERRNIFSDYDAYFAWIESVPRQGSRQFRHMLRFFSFPDRVERISSNNDRRKILKAFGAGTSREVGDWEDRQLDEKLFELRTRLQGDNPSAVLDFYEPPLNGRWSRNQTIKTIEGEVTVTVPTDEEEVDDKELREETKTPEARQSIQVQAKLARIGAVMGFKVWIPSSDRGRVSELLQPSEQAALLQELRLNLDDATMYTIKQIDVLWIRGRAIYRAFEVEQTTAVYSGLLRMADLLALQPNIDIRLHIVAPEERRDKVFIEMRRPVFSVLERGPLYRRCTFLAYESVDAMNSLEHLSHTNDSIIGDYEESTEEDEAR
jgi:hypothetical protein